MSSAWVEYVKQYATDNKITYKEAMKAAAPSYKESKQPEMKINVDIDKVIAEVKAKVSPKEPAGPKERVLKIKRVATKQLVPPV